MHQWTRQELYELVWTEPMFNLAKRFGVSDTGLAKACRRAGIPVPGRGHWAKQQGGHVSKRPPLPALRSGEDETVVIYPSAPKPEPPTIELPEAVQEKIKKIAAASPTFAVPKTLTNAHPIIAAWLEDERRTATRRRQWGEPDFSAIFKKADPALEKRRWRILSALFKALERHGFKVATEQGRLHEVSVSVGQERIGFRLFERVRQYRVELTEKEKKDPSNVAYGRKWTQKKEPTGELIFKIDAGLPGGVQHEWRDTPEGQIEDQIATIVTGFVIAAELLRQRRLERAEQERIRWEAMQRQWQEEQARKAEAERVARLVEEAAAWRKAADIRAYVEAARFAVQSGDSNVEPAKLESWAVWTLAQADQLDPLVFSGIALNG